MSKVRINDLARELETKSLYVLIALPDIGVTEKKTHSSSVEPEEAERLRQYFGQPGVMDKIRARVPQWHSEMEARFSLLRRFNNSSPGGSITQQRPALAPVTRQPEFVVPATSVARPAHPGDGGPTRSTIPKNLPRAHSKRQLQCL